MPGHRPTATADAPELTFESDPVAFMTQKQRQLLPWAQVTHDMVKPGMIITSAASYEVTSIFRNSGGQMYVGLRNLKTGGNISVHSNVFKTETNAVGTWVKEVKCTATALKDVVMRAGSIFPIAMGFHKKQTVAGRNGKMNQLKADHKTEVDRIKAHVREYMTKNGSKKASVLSGKTDAQLFGKDLGLESIGNVPKRARFGRDFMQGDIRHIRGFLVIKHDEKGSGQHLEGEFGRVWIQDYDIAKKIKDAKDKLTRGGLTDEQEIHLTRTSKQDALRQVDTRALFYVKYRNVLYVHNKCSPEQKLELPKIP